MRTEDRLARPLKALRVSVTDRCTFRCPACRPGPAPPLLPRESLLRFEELRRLAGIFAGLGAGRLRLTGGEPLLRAGLPDLVGRLRTVAGIRELALTTNGLRLRELAAPLRAAGLDRLTLSLDSLDPVRFARCRGTRAPLRQVLEGLEEAVRAGFSGIHLNCVLRRGWNEADILPLAAFARERGHVLRFIEFMSVDADGGWRMEEVVPSAEVRAILAARWPLEPLPEGDRPARRWRYRDSAGEVGFVAAVTEPFCDACGRARLSCDGVFRPCLLAGEGLALGPLLREGATDAEIRDLVAAAWRGRGARMSAAGSPVAMSRIGG